jgi:FkbM family methyltransferase
MVLGTYDDAFLDALHAGPSPLGGVVWDVGAHIGYESLAFAQVVGADGHVVAFEPNPANVREWQRNVAGNPELADRMSLQQVALGDAAGTAAFRFSDDVTGGASSGSHLASAVPPEATASYESFGVVDVACARGDDLVESGEIAAPSIIKIDVEGAEADVVRGAMNILRRHRPILLVEVHHVRAMHDLGALLHEAGYTTSLLTTPEETSSRCFLLSLPAGPVPASAA